VNQIIKMLVLHNQFILKCDDDYTAAGATTLTTSNQTIHASSISVDSCIQVSCWADYTSPSTGGYLDVAAYVTS